MSKLNKTIIMSNILLVLVALNVSSCATGVVAAGAGATYVAAKKETPLTQQAKDLHVKAAIKDALLNEGLGYLKDVEISVVDGEVLLIGIVKSAAEKLKIQEVALQASPYVKRIHNHIILSWGYPVTSYLNDSLTANMIRARLFGAKDAYLSKVDVEVFNNVVYIFGVVGSDFEKYNSERIARTGKGVMMVHSFIAVKKFPHDFGEQK